MKSVILPPNKMKNSLPGLPSHKAIQFTWEINKEETVTEFSSNIFVTALKQCLQSFSLFLLFNPSADSSHWPQPPSHLTPV